MTTSVWNRKLRILSIAAVIFTLVATTVRAAAPVFVGTKASRKQAMDTIDHSPWDALLKKYVDDNGMVNYRSLKSNPKDMQALNRYLDSLSQASPQAAASRDAKLAFWINAYNAVTLHGILREYPTTSIRNHTARLLG